MIRVRVSPRDRRLETVTVQPKYIASICKRIRDTWLTLECEAQRNVLIFPLKLTCLRDVCFQGGPSHISSL